MNSYTDALKSFVHQSKELAKAQRANETLQLEKMALESQLANQTQLCRRLVTTWLEVGGILGQGTGPGYEEIQMTYGICATELERVVGKDVEPEAAPEAG